MAATVRKRVIIILRDLCMQQPEHDKIPAIYAKLLNRMEDGDEGVKVRDLLLLLLLFTFQR